jgi:hypothetical protein
LEFCFVSRHYLGTEFKGFLKHGATEQRRKSKIMALARIVRLALSLLPPGEGAPKGRMRALPRSATAGFHFLAAATTSQWVHRLLQTIEEWQKSFKSNTLPGFSVAQLLRVSYAFHCPGIVAMDSFAPAVIEPPARLFPKGGRVYPCWLQIDAIKGLRGTFS